LHSFAPVVTVAPPPKHLLFSLRKQLDYYFSFDNLQKASACEDP
jgi:hypothetical protein